MPEVSFPGDGQDGEQPPPAVPARDEAAGVPEDDWDPDAEMTAYIADLDAGRARIPEEWELEGPAATISLGDAADVDPVVLAAMVGPDGLGGEIFAQDRPADVMPPGPVLSALTEGAISDPERLTDNQLLGAMSAARRLAARAEYLELAATAEFTRRREHQYEAAKAAKVPPGRREGEFADAELGMELVTSTNAARDRMLLAGDLKTRLPATRAALAAGMIDGYRARIIGRWTRFLTDADAATADEILAEVAPRLRYDQLARKAIAIAMKLDPEAMTRNKDQERKDRQRVEACREDSGNASLSGRELAIEDALASKAHIDALAAALRRGGLEGSLRQLRVLVYLDLTQGRDPLHRLTSLTGTGASVGDPGKPGPGDDIDGYPDGGDEDDGEDDADDEGGGGPGGGSGRPGGPPGGKAAPFPALINLIVPASTLFGWSTAPGEAGGWGLTDHIDMSRLVQAASLDPRTRWCMTLTGLDGTAVAHGCARGPHPWTPGPPGASSASAGSTASSGSSSSTARDGPGSTTALGDPASTARAGPAATADRGPGPGQTAALAQFLRELNVTLTPIARGTCNHSSSEDGYTPSRKLRHLVRARTATCPAPGCGAQAYHADLDHTLAYPAGPTDQCNLGPPCRRHHRVKQAPGWQLEQPEPGVMRWTAPSGRVYTTRPTVYDL